MIAPWMVYAVAVSFFLGGAGGAVERCLRALGLPSRWGTVAGLTASVAIPTVALVAPGHLLPDPTWVRHFLGSLMGQSLSVAFSALAGAGPIPKIGAVLDAPLLVLWTLGSLATILIGVLIQHRLVRSALRCSTDTVAGTEVRRTRRLGPAVVGYLRGIIVFPEWTRSLDPHSLRLSLAHEREHLRARDPLLLFGAYLLVGLQCWNPSLWWQLSRLKRAIEADCDQRVLAKGVDPRAYASLLLRLASHRSWSPPFAVSLGKAGSRVSRRVMLMADGLSGVRTGPAAVAGASAVALLMVGLQLPVPGASQLQSGVASGGATQGQAWRNPAGKELVGPRVVRGAEALRLIDEIRDEIALQPSHDVAVEVELADGAVLRLSSISNSPDPLVTLARPDSPLGPGQFHQVALQIDVVDGEPVITLTEV
jgi:bla regulator protein BlaR1